MSDTPDQPESLDQDATDETRTARPSLAESAEADLRRARKALGPDWSQQDERAAYLLRRAKVTAMLDLAAAMRNQDGTAALTHQEE